MHCGHNLFDKIDYIPDHIRINRPNLPWISRINVRLMRNLIAPINCERQSNLNILWIFSYFSSNFIPKFYRFKQSDCISYFFRFLEREIPMLNPDLLFEHRPKGL